MLAFYNTDRKTVKERSRSRVCINSRHIIAPTPGPPWVLGIWGEWLFIFRELGSTGNYFSDLGSKLIVLGIKGALQKSKKYNLNNLTLKEKPSFRLIF